MNELIIKLAMGSVITDSDIINELRDICENGHSSCDSTCPVFSLNGNKVPDTANDFEKNRGCDCFKNGESMLSFIRSKHNEEECFDFDVDNAITDIDGTSSKSGYKIKVKFENYDRQINDAELKIILKKPDVTMRFKLLTRYIFEMLEGHGV